MNFSCPALAVTSKLRRIFILLGLGIFGCLPMQAVSAGDASERAANCVLPEGWDAIAARDPEFVVFGEFHGTREAPAFSGSLACSLARKGERLLVAIEFSPSDDGALQNAWKADAADFEDLLLNAGWRGRPDGVASEAMFTMVRDLHRLRLEGYSIDIVAFNGTRDADQRARFVDLPSQGPHEAAQAENIAMAARAGSYDRVLVLVGNLHAMKQPYNIGRGPFDPMARRLEAYGSVVSLRMKHGGGTAWNCQRDCGVHQAKAIGSFEREPFVTLHGKSKRRDEAVDWLDAYFDGFYWVGPIFASPPKAPDHKQDP